MQNYVNRIIMYIIESVVKIKMSSFFKSERVVFLESWWRSMEGCNPYEKDYIHLGI